MLGMRCEAGSSCDQLEWNIPMFRIMDVWQCRHVDFRSMLASTSLVPRPFLGGTPAPPSPETKHRRVWEPNYASTSSAHAPARSLWVFLPYHILMQWRPYGKQHSNALSSMMSLLSDPHLIPSPIINPAP